MAGNLPLTSPPTRAADPATWDAERPAEDDPAPLPPIGAGDPAEALRRNPHRRLLGIYAFFVCTAGLLLLVVLASSPMLREAFEMPFFWLLAGLVIVAEQFPIITQRRGQQVDEITTATTFAFSAMCWYPANGVGPSSRARVW